MEKFEIQGFPYFSNSSIFRVDHLNKCFVPRFVKKTEKKEEREGLKGFERQCFYTELANLLLDRLF